VASDRRRDATHPATEHRKHAPAQLAAAQLLRAGNKSVRDLLAASGTPDGATVQRAVVSDVESRMSYGAFDWAITDEEAVDSLNDLATLPTAALGSAMGRLSSTAKTRLLDNMPASARATSPCSGPSRSSVRHAITRTWKRSR
jgi:hypothetical protein